MKGISKPNMKDRKIIFESFVGSHLYGTNNAESDEDFQGVFLPSIKDLLGTENCPTEWKMNKKVSTTIQNSKGDVDRKFYSLKRFFELAAEGQPGQLELFFAPPDKVVSYDPIWSEILDNVPLFLSRKSIVPFIGFALSQAHKASIKGENLNIIRAIVKNYDESQYYDSSITLKDCIVKKIVDGKETLTGEMLTGVPPFKIVTNKEGFTTVEFCGKNYDVGIKYKTFVNNLREIEKKFGKRTQAAANEKYDYKSLMHAYRLLGEGEELLRNYKITFPRPPEELKFLMSVKNKECGDIDHWAEITKRIDNIRQNVEPNSPLPKEAKHSEINELCMRILHRELKK